LTDRGRGVNIDGVQVVEQARQRDVLSPLVDDAAQLRSALGLIRQQIEHDAPTEKSRARQLADRVALYATCDAVLDAVDHLAAGRRIANPHTELAPLTSPGWPSTAAHCWQQKDGLPAVWRRALYAAVRLNTDAESMHATAIEAARGEDDPHGNVALFIGQLQAVADAGARAWYQLIFAAFDGGAFELVPPKPPDDAYDAEALEVMRWLRPRARRLMDALAEHQARALASDDPEAWLQAHPCDLREYVWSA
jgi:hypothetical protein